MDAGADKNDYARLLDQDNRDIEVIDAIGISRSGATEFYVQSVLNVHTLERGES